MKKILIFLAIIISFGIGMAQGRKGYIKLENCIPLEDVACWYVDKYDYLSFSLKDITHQLDSYNNANYETICEKLTNASEEYNSETCIDMSEVTGFQTTETGLQLYLDNGTGYYWEGYEWKE